MAEPTGKGRVCRILVADDDASVRAFIVAALRGEGYDVTPAETGVQAIELLSKGAFDAVITDYAMPGGVDGLAVLREARARLPNVRTALLSASHLDRDLRAKAAPLADEVAVKPISVDDLRKLAERLCAVRSP